MKSSKWKLFVYMSILILCFQNCGQKVSFQATQASSLDKASESESQPQSETPSQPIPSTPDNTNVVQTQITQTPPSADPNINNAQMKIEIPDTMYQVITLNEQNIRSSISMNQKIINFIAPPIFNIKRNGNNQLNQLNVEIQIQLLKKHTTSETVAFPGGGFANLSINNGKQEIAGQNKLNAVMQLPKEEVASISGPLNVQLELSNFIVNNQLVYGMGFYKIDYFFKEINFKKSTIILIHALPAPVLGSVANYPFPIELDFNKPPENFNDQKFCLAGQSNQKSNAIVKWKSSNSADTCISQLGPQQTALIGESIQLRGDNALHLIQGNTASGTATLTCTEQGWRLESEVCSNQYETPSAIDPTKPFDYNKGVAWIQFLIERWTPQ